MDNKWKKALLIITLFILFLSILMIILPLIWKVHVISGNVFDSNGKPISEAIVRIKTTDISTTTDGTGTFTISDFDPAFRLHITAWKDGYYIGGAQATPWDPSVQIKLTPYTVPDNVNYTWFPSAVTRSVENNWLTQTLLGLGTHIPIESISKLLTKDLELGCRDCHGKTIYDQWSNGVHSSGIQNIRFMTMYNGTNVNGSRSPLTQYAYQRDYGRFPLPPNIDQPYFGPGFKLDFPDSPGNCATCHLPTLALKNKLNPDPRKATGINTKGTHCDFCHKIVSVKLDPKTGSPYENMPGVQSIKLMRPSPEKQLFFGPYDDVDAGSDTFLPLQKQSEFCAPCHDASFWGVPIYKSFSEWKASPYPSEAKTCQSCHMKSDGLTTNFAPDRGGLKRDPNAILRHDFPGGSNEEILQNSAEIVINARRDGTRIFVEASVNNTKAGHHIPTDSPLRQIFLTVTATDEDGNIILLENGPKLPDWAGDLAGKPGIYFAKILEQLWTGITPTGAYWTQTRIVEDTRLPARKTVKSNFSFIASGNGDIKIEARLLFRRAYYDLMRQKSWDTPDILMENMTILVPSLNANG